MAHRRNGGITGKITDKNRSVYCGAYQFTAKAVRDLKSTPLLNEIEWADVVHNIEEGEISHTDLRIVLKPGCTNKNSAKTAIIDRLWAACSGPLRHSCNCDQDVHPHPSSRLSTPSRGDYTDTRCWLSRRWYIMRFGALHWLWCVRSGIRHQPESEQPAK